MNSFSWKKIWNKVKKMKRTDWLIVLGAGVLLLIIAIPTGASSERKQKNSVQEMQAEVSDDSAKNNDISTQMDAYKRELEEELEALLGKMSGVGEVKVMLTLKNDGEHILDKDISSAQDSYEENTVVYQLDKQEAPYVTSQRMPEIEGVVIVAEGGGNPATAANISDVVTALFGVEAHKVKVVKMTEVE